MKRPLPSLILYSGRQLWGSENIREDEGVAEKAVLFVVKHVEERKHWVTNINYYIRLILRFLAPLALHHHAEPF